jgi:hypothetical protein
VSSSRGFLERSCFGGIEEGEKENWSRRKKWRGESCRERKKHWLTAELEQRTDCSRTALRPPRQKTTTDRDGDEAKDGEEGREELTKSSFQWGGGARPRSGRPARFQESSDNWTMLWRAA